MIAVGGALYQYTGDLVKFMPLDGKNTIDDLINAQSDSEITGIKVSQVVTGNSASNNRDSSSSCEQGSTGNGGADHGLYVRGQSFHRTYTHYTYQYDCQYDSAYYTCWYQETSGMSYQAKLNACCPRIPIPHPRSEVYSNVNSRTSCDVSLLFFCLGDESIPVDELRISGVFTGYVDDVLTTDIVFNEFTINNYTFTHVVYDGPRLSGGYLLPTYSIIWNNIFTIQHGCTEALFVQ